MFWNAVLNIFGVLFVILLPLGIIALINKPGSIYNNQPEQKNPMEGKRVVLVENENDKENADGIRGHLEVVGVSEKRRGFYESIIKRVIDLILSFSGLVVLSPVYLVLIVAIFVEDPSPVIFTQKRVGKDKQYFKLHKFRSMKMSAPQDTPTHMLENSEQYITKVGKFIRVSGLDELPQIWDIFIGNMSIVGPRPALWNQDFLIAERDKYNVNEVKPGLIGWAQINGRNELEIPDKAKFDGAYVDNLCFKMDVKCVFGFVHVIKKMILLLREEPGK